MKFTLLTLLSLLRLSPQMLLLFRSPIKQTLSTRPSISLVMDLVFHAVPLIPATASHVVSSGYLEKVPAQRANKILIYGDGTKSGFEAKGGYNVKNEPNKSYGNHGNGHRHAPIPIRYNAGSKMSGQHAYHTVAAPVY
ncbi:hypothetical protein DL89DRAFT_254318 [Linderina pennispora]|uniref:Uncharacterized protein n=1 Tax=Linderina pennispora TaxID=61395 RepID=A0A1Y1WLN1_9FUNG|nr:uncharacterized protein DL89DRAFT_254318 [Linderina pennispora]ORX74480.1 hypothetical protein DL89DRAFT_254318 [Linderina pennispora]